MYKKDYVFLVEIYHHNMLSPCPTTFADPFTIGVPQKNDLF
jgi:hypothetical protein